MNPHRLLFSSVRLTAVTRWIFVASICSSLLFSASQTHAGGADIARSAGATTLTKASGSGLRVLILGDSMALNGFADELDASFRECPGVESVHTIAACGTNPRSWMKKAPYATTSTQCGYLSIESTGEPGGIKVVRDIYGKPAGNKPGNHRVPKIEDLVASIQPDILVFQNGNNFFDLFTGSQGSPEKSVSQVRAFLNPFTQWLSSSTPSVRRFYWVTPPEAGSVTAEVQKTVFETIRQQVSPHGVIIDSRSITSYPYSAQGEDKIHFWGKEAFDWGSDTFRIIAQDLARNPLDNRPRSRRNPLPPPVPDLDVVEVRRAILVEDEKTAPSPKDIVMRVKLEKMTPVPPPASFAPYGDLLVAGLYRVVKVTSGKYSDSHIVILHPAYIKHKLQPIDTRKRFRSTEVRVRELDTKSLWATVRRQDSVAPFELFPYMIVTDEARHPNY